MISLLKSFDNSILCGKSNNLLAAFDAAITNENREKQEDTERQFSRHLSEFSSNKTVMSAFDSALNQKYAPEKKTASNYTGYQNQKTMAAFEKALVSCM